MDSKKFHFVLIDFSSVFIGKSNPKESSKKAKLFLWLPGTPTFFN